MLDGSTREVDEARAYAEGMAAIRAGVDSPWFDLVRNIDLDALPADGPVDLLALLRSFAFDGDKRRAIPDLSEDSDGPPTPSYVLTPEDEAREAEIARKIAEEERIRTAPLSDLTPAERRQRLAGGR
jgi:hypothetical protein